MWKEIGKSTLMIRAQNIILFFNYIIEVFLLLQHIHVCMT